MLRFVWLNPTFKTQTCNTKTYYFKLFWIIFIHKCNWNSHYTIIINWYIRCLINVNCIEILIPPIIIRTICFIENQIFMTLLYLEVCKPIHSRNTNHTFTMVACCSSIFIFADKMSGSTFETITKPQFIISYQRKYLMITNCILMSYYHKFLVVLHQLRHIFTK